MANNIVIIPEDVALFWDALPPPVRAALIASSNPNAENNNNDDDNNNNNDNAAIIIGEHFTEEDIRQIDRMGNPHEIPMARKRQISTADAEIQSRSPQQPIGFQVPSSSRFRRLVDRVNGRARDPELNRESRAFPIVFRINNRRTNIGNRMAMAFAYLAELVPPIPRIVRNNRGRNRERNDNSGAEEREPKRQREEVEPPKIKHLRPCEDPPQPGTPGFKLLFKKFIVELVWDYLEQNNQFDEYSQGQRNDLDKISDPNKVIEKKYKIISTQHLTDDQRNMIRLSAKDKEKKGMLVSDILAIHLATDKCISRYVCASRNKKYAVWVQNVAFPVGRKGMPKEEPSIKQCLDECYDCPNILLSFYLIHMIRLFQNGDLKAYAPKNGRKDQGEHWASICDIRSRVDAPNSKFRLPGVCVICTVNRLPGFANSVLNGYHKTICGEDPRVKSFKRSAGKKKMTVKYGRDTMLNGFHTCHLLCERSEVLDNGTGANFCLNANHVICADGASVNAAVSFFLFCVTSLFATILTPCRQRLRHMRNAKRIL